MSKKTWFSVLLVAVVMLAIVALTFVRRTQHEIIKIAVIMPLSGDGAMYGVPQRNAAQMAVGQVNAKGRIRSRRLQLTAFDDRASPRDAVTLAHKICSQDFLAVCGHPNSGTAIPASKVYNKAGLLYVGTTATNPKLTQQGFDNVFRFAPTDEMQGVSLAKFVLNDLGKRALIILDDSTAYGRGLADSVSKHFISDNGAIEYRDSLIAGQQDYRALLRKLASHETSTVFFGGMMPEAVKLVRQAKELGIEKQFLFGDGCFDEKFHELSGTDCSNVYISFLAPPWDTVPSAKDFVTSYRKIHGRIDPFAPYGYDCIMIVAKALEKSPNFERRDLVQAIHSPGFTVEGVTGKITFASDGQAKDTGFYVYRFENEHLKLFK